MSKYVGKTVTVYLDDPSGEFGSEEAISGGYRKIGYRWYFPHSVGILGGIPWDRIGEYTEYLLTRYPGWDVRIHIEDVHDDTKILENIGIDFNKIDFFEEDGKYEFRPYPEIMD